MLEYLNELDTTVLLAINGWNSTFQDYFWWMMTAKWASVLMALALVWVMLHKPRRYALLVLVSLALALVLADQFSSSVIKPLVERLRPTHEPSLEGVIHIINGYHGGMFGFVSSHAANSFAVAMFLSLVFRRRIVTLSLFIWGALQCYSRMYVGVHYPGDIMGGIVVGLLAGWLVWCLMKWCQRRMRISNAVYTSIDGIVIALSLVITLIAITAVALYQALG